jgi:hypothetical protein
VRYVNWRAFKSLHRETNSGVLYFFFFLRWFSTYHIVIFFFLPQYVCVCVGDFCKRNGVQGKHTHTNRKKDGRKCGQKQRRGFVAVIPFSFLFFSPRLLSPSFGNVYASRVNPLTRRRDRWSGLKHAAFLSCSPPLFEVLCRIVFGYICTCKK